MMKFHSDMMKSRSIKDIPNNQELLIHLNSFHLTAKSSLVRDPRWKTLRILFYKVNHLRRVSKLIRSINHSPKMPIAFKSA